MAAGHDVTHGHPVGQWYGRSASKLSMNQDFKGKKTIHSNHNANDGLRYGRETSQSVLAG